MKAYLQLLILFFGLNAYGQVQISSNYQKVDLDICKGQSIILDAEGYSFCDSILNNEDVTINDGGIYCIDEGTSYNSNLNLINGTLVIKGVFSPSNLTATGGTIVNGGTSIFPVGFNSTSTIVANMGTLTLYNEISFALENAGKIYIPNNLIVNSVINNSGRIEVSGDLQIDNLFFNNGHVVCKDLLATSHSITIDRQAYFNAENIIIDAPIVVQPNSFGMIEVSDSSVFGPQVMIDGELRVCDANGIEVNNSAFLVYQSCTIDTISPTVFDLSTMHYEWTPVLGLSDPNSSKPIASPVQDTDYEVTITDFLGNKVSITYAVNVKELAGGDQTICTNTEAVLNADLSCQDVLVNNCQEFTSPVNCATCQNQLSGNGYVEINAGQTYCIPEGQVFSGSVTIKGGELIVCGELSPSSINFNGGVVTVNGIANINSITINGTLNNYGLINISNTTQFGWQGTFNNYGTFETYSFSGAVNNQKNFIANTGQFDKSSSNVCSILINGNLTLNNNFQNSGTVWVAGSLVQNSGTISLQGGQLACSNATFNANVNAQNGKQSSIKVEQTTNINSGTMSGTISFCDANGIETNWGTQTSDVVFSCNQTTNNYDNIAFHWLPAKA